MTSSVVTGVFRGDWTTATAYSAGDVVTFNGASYVVSAAHTSGPVFSTANMLGTGGMGYRGAWAPATAYSVNDVVTYGGETLVATTAHTSAATFALTNWAWLTATPGVFNVALYGAQGDGRLVNDGAMTSASATLTSATAAFAVADVGKAIIVKGAGSATATTLVTTISAYVNATTVTLAATAATTASGAYVLWGTDDTVAVQAATNAACAYAAAHGGFGKVRVPASPGAFYAIAGALVKGGATKGSSQITLPVAAYTANKLSIEFEGAGNGSALFHWNQTIPQVNGSTLVSFGVYANAGAQTADITANGNPALIGAPNQIGGYGTNALLFSNMLVTLRNLALVTTFSVAGLGYGAFDFSGLAEANVFDCAIGVATTFADLQSPGPLSAGLSIGALMPANGNNDNNVLRNFSVMGGYTFALYATEHTIIQGLRITYCWAALCPIGAYFSSVGASHAVYVDQFSCEGCIRHVYLIGSGQSGIGPTVTIGQLDTEGTPILYDASNGGAGGFGLGDIAFTGFNPVSVPNPTGIKLRNLIQQPGYVATPSFTLGVAFMNAFWRDATVVVTGGTVTAIKVGKPTAGAGCLGGASAPAMQATGVTSGTFRVPAGGWLEVDGSVAPTMAWVLD